MRLIVLILLAVGNISAQNSGLGARQLYEDAPPPKPPRGKNPPKKGGDTPPALARDTRVPDSTPNIVPVALHLGLRYNILKTDPTTGATQNVDPESNFKAGDCLQIEFRPNRDGYLYVFNSGSSGAWQPLLPSVQMPDEANHITNGATAKVPQNFCFQLKDPRGVDTVLVVVTERSEDVYKLNQAIRGSVQGDDGQGKPAPSPGGIGETLAALQQIADPRTAGGALVGRDIEIQVIGTPRAKDEPPNSVYAVKTSATPNEHLVIQVKLRHE